MAKAHDHLERFKSLMRAYDDETQGYIPRAIMEKEQDTSPFDHLSRWREWSLTEEQSVNLRLNTASWDQRRASDPLRSVWVAANAGSGKTHVLVDRVIRLMLSGTPPDKILCITFTKAAAAEMATRLHARLAAWVGIDDAELARHIRAMGHDEVTSDTLKRARELFTLALETPGGLKIQTIHAFCERLLQLFPVEAGVVPGFEVMDERSSAELLDQARRSIIAEAETTGDPALRRIVARAQAEAFDELLRTILVKRSELSVDLDYLRRQLRLAPAETAASIESELFAFDVALYDRLICDARELPAHRRSEIGAGLAPYHDRRRRGFRGPVPHQEPQAQGSHLDRQQEPADC